MADGVFLVVDNCGELATPGVLRYMTSYMTSNESTAKGSQKSSHAAAVDYVEKSKQHEINCVGAARLVNILLTANNEADLTRRCTHYL